MRPTPRPAVPEAQGAITAIRRRMGAGNPLHFASVYLPHCLTAAPSPMHEEICVLLAAASTNRGRRIAIAAPRGHAKSTIVSLAYTLWSICYRRERYVTLISETSDQASQHLSHIKHELESNLCLRADFPQACEIPGAKPAPERWRQNEIITRNEVMVTALGSTKRMRGRRNAQNRPSLVILDDVESEQNVESPEQRRKLRTWFERTVLKAGDARTNFIVVGTILHYDSMLAALVDPLKSPGWTGKVYRAITSWANRQDLWGAWEAIYSYRGKHDGEEGPDAARKFFDANSEAMLEGAAILWPGREDYYRLMEIRLTEGVASFDSEMQNDPVDPENCLFREGEMQFWDDRWGSDSELLASLEGKHEIIGACDPSLGRAGRRGDFTAIVSVLRDTESGRLYVLDADIRKQTPDAALDAILEYHRIREYDGFAFEGNQFQELMRQDLERRALARGLVLDVTDIKHTADKVARIQALQPLVRSGNLCFSRRHRVLLEQLRQFPRAAHDDGPDALEMAVSLAREERAVPRIWVI